MSELKNKAGIAEAVGWLSALSDAVMAGVISEAQGELIASEAGRYVADLLHGGSVHGKSLASMAFLDNAFEPQEGTLQ